MVFRSFIKKGPDYIKNKLRILNKIDLDATFTTTIQFFKF